MYRATFRLSCSYQKEKKMLPTNQHCLHTISLNSVVGYSTLCQKSISSLLVYYTFILFHLKRVRIDNFYQVESSKSTN